MSTTIIYGAAVQEARNLLRSAQISTMFEILRLKLFEHQDNYSPSNFDVIVNRQINNLADQNPNSTKLQEAKRRANDFLNASTIEDVFAIGDAIRLVGEYYESLGAGDVNQFRSDLRNSAAFNKFTNRTRTDVAESVIQGELPELGIFKFRLGQRSVLKYMERAYGPYIGADISGSTTDSLAVLAMLFYSESGGVDPNLENLASTARKRLSQGDELVPIATMVLQYHHSLIECGTALALASTAFSNQPALKNVNPYNYQTFTVQQGVGPSSQQIKPALDNGNETLATNLNGKGLFIIRDFIDIQHNPYVDCEIALLLDDPQDSELFDLGKRYPDFASARQMQTFSSEYVYQSRDPSLLALADTCDRELDRSTDFGDDDRSALDIIKNLCSLNSTALKQLGAFNSIDAAFAAPAPNNAQAQLQPNAVNAVPQGNNAPGVVGAVLPNPAGASASGIRVSPEVQQAASRLLQLIGVS